MLKVGKDWHYLYRGTRSDGKLVDVRSSKERDVAATSAYEGQVVATMQVQPTETPPTKIKPISKP